MISAFIYHRTLSILGSTTISIEVNFQGLPASWLTETPAKYLIDRADWNTDAAPAEDTTYGTLHVYVEWEDFGEKRLLAPEGISNQHTAHSICSYFGIAGCIIPVGFIPDFDCEMLAFTIAGPCDSFGEVLYILIYSPHLDMSTLKRITRGFSSIRLSLEGYEERGGYPCGGWANVFAQSYVPPKRVWRR
ncbi:hypothetical protein FB451DRAFT_1185732 [Mycena latifolia]|nr:hypothetical protein FB451DRAFT_1185732 [Mycena latifolia]